MQPIDIAEYLDSQKAIEGYLTLCLKSSDPGVFWLALDGAVRATGIESIAGQFGISPDKIRRVLDPKKSSPYQVVHKILSALNVRLHCSHRSRSRKVISHSDNSLSSNCFQPDTIVR